MYYRNPDYICLAHFTQAARTPPSNPRPISPLDRLLLSVGLIVAPVVAFFLILGIGRLMGGL